MGSAPTLAWSGQFALLPQDRSSGSSPSPSRRLPGDKIILPPSSLEQLLAAAASSLAASSSAAASPDGRGFGHAQRASQPQHGEQLPHPLMFRLVNPGNGKAVFAGIREFSAPEGRIGLSPYLAEALGLESRTDAAATDESTPDLASHNPFLEVHAHQLPKGTYVRLRTLEAGYEAADWKSLLERHLGQNFTCLTKGLVLAVAGLQGETFNFLVDGFTPPGDGICVVDTDLEVDIEALDEEQARETLRQIMIRDQARASDKSSPGGELDIWNQVKGHVAPGDYVDYVLPSWDRSQPLAIRLSDIEDQERSPELFVTAKSSRQRGPPRESAHVFGSFAPAQDGSKTISIAPSNAELDDAESILIAVHAPDLAESTQLGASPSSGPISYTLRVRAGSRPPGDAGGDGADAERSGGGELAEEEQCGNCLQWVPRRTMALHESFCRRNKILCSRCQTVFQRQSAEWEAHWHCERDDAHGNSGASRERHDEVFHKERKCPSCEFSTNSLPDLARHRTTICPGKLILCRFCRLEVAQEGDGANPSPEVMMSGMTAHELADGARTTECHLCDKIVRLRDMETHMKHHELDKAGRSKPAICRNLYCGRTLHGVGPRGRLGVGGGSEKLPNEVGLCSLCFGPLYVSMHDPDGKALGRRIERRYLGQMMTGCGKAHCVNEWCRTGRERLGLEAKGGSAQAVLPLVKPLVQGAQGQGAAVYFCVDEANQARRKAAEMVAAEKVWDLEWCVAAAEAEKGDVGRMREWLQAWAPRR